ncbi:hypothetical protein WR25_10105 [Diploscapter pachys]|uniref:TIL domain-containing protein n=1 Tax=Diploscapter pachys TaxID=2018661 RepID=A0A2A2J550_9BILA|nr:hypothetical protein WR25_10105 [Diploscapter pachys]
MSNFTFPECDTCKSGCGCLNGFVRNDQSYCIPIDFCEELKTQLIAERIIKLYEDKPLEEKGFRKPALLLTGPRPGFAPLRLVSSNDTESISALNENLAELSTTKRPKLHRLPRLRMAMRVKSKTGRRRARISAQSRVKPIAPPVAPPRADQAMPMPPAHQPGPPASRPDTSYGPPGIYPSKYYRLKRLQKQMKRAQRLKEKLEQRRKLQRIMEFRSK